MTEHVQIELIAALVLIAGQVITVWRANWAAAHARNANDNAVEANNVAVVARAENARAIEQVHEAVNGGMAAGKREIAALKDEITRLNLIIDRKPSPLERHEEIRGQTS